MGGTRYFINPAYVADTEPTMAFIDVTGGHYDEDKVVGPNTVTVWTRSGLIENKPLVDVQSMIDGWVEVADRETAVADYNRQDVDRLSVAIKAGECTFLCTGNMCWGKGVTLAEAVAHCRSAGSLTPSAPVFGRLIRGNHVWVDSFGSHRGKLCIDVDLGLVAGKLTKEQKARLGL